MVGLERGAFCHATLPKPSFIRCLADGNHTIE